MKNRHGLPLEYISCPSCGDEYGADGRKVNMETEECEKCSPDGEMVDADTFVNYLYENNRI